MVEVRHVAVDGRVDLTGRDAEAIAVAAVHTRHPHDSRGMRVEERGPRSQARLCVPDEVRGRRCGLLRLARRRVCRDDLAHCHDREARREHGQEEWTDSAVAHRRRRVDWTGLRRADEFAPVGQRPSS